MSEPVTDEEWQEAADAAHVLLLIDSAQKYGFVSGGPVVEVDRCLDLLRQADERGVRPAADAVERAFDAGSDE